MLDQFKEYLINKGYSEYTPSGKPSTVYDYIKRVERICERENISINTLAGTTDRVVAKYDEFGEESDFGRKSHNAYISALKRFQEFIQ